MYVWARPGSFLPLPLRLTKLSRVIVVSAPSQIKLRNGPT